MWRVAASCCRGNPRGSLELVTHRGALLVVLSLLAFLPASGQEMVFVEAGSPLTYLANPADPGTGMSWTAESFDDSSWSTGFYGIGYETNPPGAQALLQTTVPSNTLSVFTRTTFNISGMGQINTLFVGADYDDAYVVWINDVEVFRSPEVPAGPLTWNTSTGLHESSNALLPDYGSHVDISTIGVSALSAQGAGPEDTAWANCGNSALFGWTLTTKYRTYGRYPHWGYPQAGTGGLKKRASVETRLGDLSWPGWRVCPVQGPKLMRGGRRLGPATLRLG